MALTRRPIRLALLVMAGCCVMVLLGLVYRAQNALDAATRSAKAGQRTGFTLKPFETASHATSFELLPAAMAYSSGVALDGQLFLTGPEGLTILGADGVPRVHLRTGIELPVSQITAVTTGRVRGASEPQALIATAGAGVFFMTAAGRGAVALQQLLPASAEAADVTALLVLASGDLLLGTRHSGVFIFNGTTLEPLPMHVAGFAANHLQVTALAAPDATSVLIGTRNEGVFYLHAGTAEHAGVAEGMPDNQVDALAFSGSHVFVGTPLGVAEFALLAGEFRPVGTLVPGVFAHALAVSADGKQLSVGTLDEGVRTVALGGAASFRQVSITVAAPAQRQGRVDDFILAPGALFALVNGRLQSRSGTMPEPATSSQSLTDRNISALAFDDKGALFIGYFDHGLDVLAHGAVTHFEDDSLFCINRLALDPARKTMAAATANGLVLFDEQAAPRQTLTRKDGLLSEHVTDVAFSRTGTVLATPAGITFLNAGGAESLYAFQGLVNNHVYALAANTATDRVLAGTLGGLSLLDAEQVRRNLTVANSGLKHNWITALAQAGPGEWLVGTYGAGVMRMSAQGTFTALDIPRDLVVNPNALLVTASHVYAGTLGHGMLMYTTATGRWSMVTTGLPSWNVTAFAEREGELYVGTANGLVRVAEASL